MLKSPASPELPGQLHLLWQKTPHRCGSRVVPLLSQSWPSTAEAAVGDRHRLYLHLKKEEDGYRPKLRLRSLLKCA